MSFSKKSLWMLLLTFTLALVLAACGEDDKEDTSTNTDDTGTENTDSGTTEENTATTGGDLVIAELSDAQSLDPHGSNDVSSSNVQSNIYETLVNRDADGNLVPGLAESWTQVDELTWEFKLIHQLGNSS